MNMLKLTAGIAALAALSACGLKGDLERPEPIWGEPARPQAPVEPAKPATPDTPAAEDDVPDDELLGGL